LGSFFGQRRHSKWIWRRFWVTHSIICIHHVLVDIWGPTGEIITILSMA
jgi:hypothetical protein